MTKLGVAGLAALLEPGAAAKAATASAGVLVGATHGAYGAGRHCDGVHVWALGTEYTEIDSWTEHSCACECMFFSTLASSLLAPQACMPSTHVWTTFVSPFLPHCLYQAPPGAQQLSSPEFLMVPHLGHATLGFAVIGGLAPASIDERPLVQHEKGGSDAIPPTI